MNLAIDYGVPLVSSHKPAGFLEKMYGSHGLHM